MKKKSLWISASTALAAAVALAGCGSTYYFDGRVLPPSGLTNRVVIAIQNPGILSKGALQIVDAYYDERSGYNGTPGSFSIAGFGGGPRRLPSSAETLVSMDLGRKESKGVVS